MVTLSWTSRLATLRVSGLLDSLPERNLDRHPRFARELLDKAAPFLARIDIVGSTRARFRSRSDDGSGMAFADRASNRVGSSSPESNSPTRNAIHRKEIRHASQEPTCLPIGATTGFQTGWRSRCVQVQMIGRSGMQPMVEESKKVHLAGVGDLTLRRVLDDDHRSIESLARRGFATRLAKPGLTPWSWTQSPDPRACLLKHAFGLFREPCGTEGARALGLASLRVPADEPQVGLIRLLVDPAFRGLGIGRLLIEHLEACAQHEGLACLKARTWSANVAMLALARRTGFRVRRLFGDEPVLLVRTLGSKALLNAGSRQSKAAELQAR